MSRILLLLTLIPWNTYLYWMGIPGILERLGGCFALYVLYPVLLVLSMKYPQLRRYMWLAMSNIVALIIVNHYYMYLLGRTPVQTNTGLNMMLGIFGAQQIGLVLGPVFFACDGFAKPELRMKHEEFSQYYFYNANAFMALLFSFCGVIMIKYIDKLHEGMMWGLVAVIFYGVLMLSTTRYVTVSEMKYFFRPTPIINVSAARAKTFSLGLTALAILISVPWESRRGQWELWFLTMLVFVLQVLLLLRFSKASFVQEGEYVGEPLSFNFPAKNNPDSKYKLGAFTVAYILLAIFAE